MTEFDKEAEREKLRQQFTEDERKREATQRMSELLLKGATMTNAHCDQCGDPIFRWQDQEFCPTCSADAEGEPVQQAAEQQGSDPAAGESQPRAGSPDTQASNDQHAEPPVENPTGPARTAVDAPAVESNGGPETGVGIEDAEPTQQSVTPSPDQRPAPSQSTATGPVSDLEGASASLVRTITRFAERAESIDDPSRARDHLSTVEAAASALRALREADRER